MVSETEGVDAVHRVESRRNVLIGTAAGLAAGLFVSARTAQGLEAPPGGALDVAVPAFDSTHELRPLPFESSSLKGLSAGLIESHWSNNYGGSVRALNETNRRLAAALADPEPLLVIDMYEHSYHMDYGAATARYIDAFFANIQWDAVSVRLGTL